MNQSMNMSDFFGMEASEYLEKLDALVSGSQPPDTTEFARLCRALRGSAMMANRAGIAKVAGGLESLAKRMHDGTAQWDPATKQLAIRAVDDMKIFVRSLSDWNDEMDRKVQTLANDLTAAFGAQEATERSSGIDTGTRAFVGREGSAAAAALDRAAGVVAHKPEQAVIEDILQTMRPLRGVASLNDLPPMPDILDTVERVLDAFRKDPTLEVAQLSEIFKLGGAALAQAAKEVAASGTASGAADAALQFANLVSRAFESEGALKPIEQFFYDDAGPHIVTRGTPPAERSIGEMELIAHGEHLTQAADSLEQAQTDAEHELRRQAVQDRLATLAAAAGGAVSEAVAEFAVSARKALLSRPSIDGIRKLTDRLRTAAATIAETASEAEQAVADKLKSIAQEVSGGERRAATEVAPEPAATPAPPVGHTVPPSAAPEPPAAPPVEYGTSLAASFEVFERLQSEQSDTQPSLETLISSPTPMPGTEPVTEPEPEPVAAPAPAPVAQPEPAPEPVAVSEPEPEATPEPEREPQPTAPVEAGVADAPPIDEFLVPVTDFCYSGARALERAVSLKGNLQQALNDPIDLDAARALVGEVLDLVELGIKSD